MTARLFRLFEMHQRIDERLRLMTSRRGADLHEVNRLAQMKLRVKALIHRLTPSPLVA